jgi:dynamin 1-like protein
MARYCMGMVTELQRFPLLRKRMEEVIGNFLLEGLNPSKNVIEHIIDMEVCT